MGLVHTIDTNNATGRFVRFNGVVLRGLPLVAKLNFRRFLGKGTGEDFCRLGGETVSVDTAPSHQEPPPCGRSSHPSTPSCKAWPSPLPSRVSRPIARSF